MTDGLVEAWMLGDIAGSLSARTHAETAQGFFEHMRHKRELAEADAEYAALVDQYNHLVDRFNYVYTCAKDWEVEGARRSERNKALQQELVAANERAAAAEQRVITLEQWGNDLAVREAEARRDATFYQERYRSMSDRATQRNLELADAKAEIARLEAIITGMRGSGDQGTPFLDTPAP